MSVKVTVPNGSSDYLTFGSANTPDAAKIGGYDDGSSAGHMEFYTTTGGTSTERMRIDANGNVGIGTSSPAYKAQVKTTTFADGISITDGTYNHLLDIRGNTLDIRADTTNTAGDMRFFVNGATERMRIDSAGVVKMTAYGTGTLYTNGGSLTNINPSDERLKDNIADIAWGLADIQKLRPVSYVWKNDIANQGTQYGFIAQEVKEVLPELVREFEHDEDGEIVTRLGLEKDGIYATLVKAIQEQQAIITDLKSRIEALESK